MTAPETSNDTVSLAQPFGPGVTEFQALRETQPAKALGLKAETAQKTPTVAGDWSQFVARILGPAKRRDR